MSFLFVSNASAARIDLTLGWHNLQEFFLVDSNEGDSVFEIDTRIKTGLLKGSVLGDPLNNLVNPYVPIKLADLGFDETLVDMWRLDTHKKFNKWINKKSKKALKSAAKQFQKDEYGSKKGWKEKYREWKLEDLWELYNEESFVAAAFDKKFIGKTFNGRIGDQKFKATMGIFENSWDNNPVPEPATMILFGLGLIGLAGASRKKQ